MKTILEQFGVQILPYVVTALGGLLCALSAMGIKYLQSKTKNAKIQAVLERLDSTVEDAVKSAQQSVLGAVKPGDSLELALAGAKKAALDSVKSHFGATGIDELKKVLGWDDGLLEKNLATKLESKVHDLKLERAQAGANGVPKTSNS